MTEMEDMEAKVHVLYLHIKYLDSHTHKVSLSCELKMSVTKPNTFSFLALSGGGNWGNRGGGDSWSGGGGGGGSGSWGGREDGWGGRDEGGRRGGRYGGGGRGGHGGERRAPPRQDEFREPSAGKRQLSIWHCVWLFSRFVEL